MSSQKTEHYQLHKWDPGDNFLREEFNENFAAVDQGLMMGRVVTGTYTGTMSLGGSTNSNQTITLGFRPAGVFVTARDYNFAGRGVLMVLSVDGASCSYLEITDTGFIVKSSMNTMEDGDTGKNYPRNPFRYLAWH